MKFLGFSVVMAITLVGAKPEPAFADPAATRVVTSRRGNAPRLRRTLSEAPVTAPTIAEDPTVRAARHEIEGHLESGQIQLRTASDAANELERCLSAGGSAESHVGRARLMLQQLQSVTRNAAHEFELARDASASGGLDGTLRGRLDSTHESAASVRELAGQMVAGASAETLRAQVTHVISQIDALQTQLADTMHGLLE